MLEWPLQEAGCIEDGFFFTIASWLAGGPAFYYKCAKRIQYCAMCWGKARGVLRQVSVSACMYLCLKIRHLRRWRHLIPCHGRKRLTFGDCVKLIHIIKGFSLDIIRSILLAEERSCYRRFVESEWRDSQKMEKDIVALLLIGKLGWINYSLI